MMAATKTRRAPGFMPIDGDETSYVVWFYGQHLNAGRSGEWNVWGRRPTEAEARELMAEQQRKAERPMLAPGCAKHWRIVETRVVTTHHRVIGD
jgi:hypothetical protein